MSTTTDLSQFGWRERRMAATLLTASCDHGFPEDFSDDEVTLMMNSSSGNVFLTNANYEVAMMNGDKLESFYSCPECGHEGFKEDMEHDGSAGCQRYLRDIGVLNAEDGFEDSGVSAHSPDAVGKGRGHASPAPSQNSGGCYEHDRCE